MSHVKKKNHWKIYFYIKSISRKNWPFIKNVLIWLVVILMWEIKFYPIFRTYLDESCPTIFFFEFLPIQFCSSSTKSSKSAIAWTQLSLKNLRNEVLKHELLWFKLKYLFCHICPNTLTKSCWKSAKGVLFFTFSVSNHCQNG